MKVFSLKKGSIYALPVLHYTMEFAMHVKLLCAALKPDCIAVELPELHTEYFLRAAARLPDISVIEAGELFYMCEPCDASMEGLRLGLENRIPTYCIDLGVDSYPLYKEHFPDPYAISRIGFQEYYTAYLNSGFQNKQDPLDIKRELHMARRLKELSFSYEKILFIGGFHHVPKILHSTEQDSFEIFQHAQQTHIRLATLTEQSCREVMAEFGWMTIAYELWREQTSEELLDRQKVIYHLYKSSGERYCESTGHPFLGYHLRTTMKFVRNLSFIRQRLMPNLFEILSAAKGCVDHNFAYETWDLATSYPYRKNIDGLEELSLSVEQVWKNAKKIHFYLKQKRRKGFEFQKRKKDQKGTLYRPPSPFSICSYPPEDTVIEKFGEFLKKKGNILLTEESGKSTPFSTSLEDGIDTKETLRHLHEKRLYVKTKGRPPGAVGSVVVVFNPDALEESLQYQEKYPWKTTWHGEHKQESDMAFYATPMTKNIVGPGISRCEYGGFMMSYPPRRLIDIWHDPDYNECLTKAEVLLMAAIDYALKPLVVYVAEKPPRSKIRQFAQRFGKKIVFIPLKQLSPIMLNKIRVFHVLDGHDKREFAGDYIY